MFHSITNGCIGNEITIIFFEVTRFIGNERIIQFGSEYQQQRGTEKSTKSALMKGSAGTADNPKCFGVSQLVGGVQC